MLYSAVIEIKKNIPSLHIQTRIMQYIYKRKQTI